MVLFLLAAREVPRCPDRPPARSRRPAHPCATPLQLSMWREEAWHRGALQKRDRDKVMPPFLARCGVSRNPECGRWDGNSADDSRIHCRINEHNPIPSCLQPSITLS
jgi:hypothetical protein